MFLYLRRYPIRLFSKILLAAFVIVSLASYAEGVEKIVPEYYRETASNGATIVSSYIPESELVTIQIRVLSGLSNEGEYASSGISHLLEHLLFKGTEEKSSEDIRKEIKMMGGIVNGSTGLDSAEYHITVPNERFEEALSLLVSMVTQPAFTDSDFEKEKEVILREINLREDDPMSKRIRLLFSESYRENVYKYPIIGYAEVFKKLTKEDVARYHASVYRPERMVIGIVGGVHPEEAMERAKEELEPLKRALPWASGVELEPRQVDVNVESFEADVVVGYLAMGFHTTSLFSKDLYNTDVLNIILGVGESSRLYKRLVKEKQLLYSIGSLNYTPKYPGLFIVTAIGDADKLAEAREEIMRVIEELKWGKISKEELERAKNMVISDYLFSHESIEALASSMTISQILTGDPAFFAKYVDEVGKVQESDIKSSCRKFLTEENSTTVYLVPKGFLEEEVVLREKKKMVKSDVSAEKLLNGLTIVVKERRDLPLVTVSFASKGGLRAEKKENSGISNLTSNLLLKGTKKRKESQIVPAIEQMGGSISSFSGMNSIGLSMHVLSKDLDKGMGIFQDVLSGAIFPEEELEKEKKKIIASIREEEKDIFSKGMLEVRKLLYTSHPYSMRIKGTVEAVESFTREDVSLFYAGHIVPEGSVLTVVGDIDAPEVLEGLVKRFKKWKGSPAPIEKESVLPLEKEKTESLTMDKEQSLFILGFQGVDLKDQRKYTLRVISSLMSGADGLLFFALRETEGITYTLGAVSAPQVDKGYFFLYAATQEEDLASVRKKLLEVIEKVKKGDIQEEEIEASKRRLISEHALNLQTNSALAMTLTLDELYGLGLEDYKKFPEAISRVSMEDVKRVSQEILDLSESAEVVIHSKK